MKYYIDSSFLKNMYDDEDMVLFSEGGKYPNGGTNPPIFTSNPNDPRIQAYKDSLDLYNKGKLEKQEIERNYPYRIYGDNDFTREYETPLYGRYNDMRIKPVYWSAYYKSFEDAAKNNNSTFGAHFAYDYQKPVQPIVYKPEEKKTTNNRVIHSSDLPFNPYESSRYEPDPNFTYGEGTVRLKIEQPINIQQAKPDLLQGTNQQLEFNPIPFKKNTFFTRKRQPQELDRDKTDYFDSKTGKLLGTFGNGGNISNRFSQPHLIKDGEYDGEDINHETIQYLRKLGFKVEIL